MSLALFSENAKIELRHQSTGEPTGLVLELLPLDHDDIHKAKVDALKSLRVRKITETADVVVDLDTKIGVLAAAVVNWEVKPEAQHWRDAFTKMFGFADDTFSKEKILALLSHKQSAWIRSQIDTALADTESFFREASNG